MNKLVSAKQMLDLARKEKYAIAHFNINNLEWTKAILEVAEETKSPIILGVSEGASKYMGGFETISNLVINLIKNLKVNVPVALHLDHGQSLESCKKAIDSGFSSVMFDGSHLTLEENLRITKEVVKYAHSKGVSVESEVGAIGGEEDGVVGTGELANVKDCKTMESFGVDFLAAGINNIHGPYPKNWKGLNFELLKEISQNINLPLVLHGGSGINMSQIKNAISLGISKINVNTELQLEFQKATREYILQDKDLKDKGYDPRKLLAPGTKAIKNKVIELLNEFGSFNKAK